MVRPDRRPNNPWAERADYQLTPADMTPNDRGQLFDAEKLPTRVEQRRANFYDAVPTIYSERTRSDQHGYNIPKIYAAKDEQRQNVARALADHTTVEPEHLAGIGEIKFFQQSKGGGHYQPSFTGGDIQVGVPGGDTVHLLDNVDVPNYGLSTLVHEVGHHVSHTKGSAHLKSGKPRVAGTESGSQMPEEEAWADDYARLNYSSPTESYGDHVSSGDIHAASGEKYPGKGTFKESSPEFRERYRAARTVHPLSNDQFHIGFERGHPNSQQGVLFNGKRYNDELRYK